MKERNSLHVDTNSQKLIVDKIFFWLSMVKNRSGQYNLVSGLWNWLYQNEQMKLTDFFACWHKFTQIKKWLKIFGVSMVKNRNGQFVDDTLKLTVSEEWTDGRNWFFACWYKLRKIKNWFNDFQVGVVKNGHVLLVHETLKTAVSNGYTEGFRRF